MANSKKKTVNKVASETAPKRGRGRPRKVVAEPGAEPSAVKNDSLRQAWSKRKTMILVAAVVLLAALPSVYFYNKYQSSQNENENPAKTEQEEAKKLVNEIAEHALLPTGEEPTVATVSDINQLADQPFFAEAQNGDKVLVYSQAKKVVLYRPSIKRLVNMTQLNLNEETTPAPSEAPNPAPAQ